MNENKLVIPELPNGLSQPTLRALKSAGLVTLKSLSKVTYKEVATLHGMGPKGMKILIAAMKLEGLSFKS